MQLPNAERLGKLPLRADLLAQKKRLRELEERVRKQNQAHWEQVPVKDDDSEGWLLSYLDLLTLLLVMFVALLILSGSSQDTSEDTDKALATPSTEATAVTDDGATLVRDTLLVGSTALPYERWEEAGNLSWTGLMPGNPTLPMAPPLPFDRHILESIEAETRPAAPLPNLAVEMPYTPVPALIGLAPPRPLAGVAVPGTTLAATSATESAPLEPHMTAPAGPDGESSNTKVTTSASGTPASSASAADSSLAEVEGSSSGGPGPSLLPEGLNLDLLGEGIDVIVRERSVSFRISSELLFGLGQVELTSGGQDVLKRVLAVLQGTDLPITVEGHTDPIPIRNERFPSNWELSTARATSVLRRLIEGGIDPTRLRAIGYADTRPLASNDTTQGRAQNRRVEVILEMPGGKAADKASPTSN